MNRSETIGALAEALSALQGELSHVGKNSHGYGYDYADLAAVLDIARPLLAKHGLALTQFPALGEPGTVALESILAHKSGEWMSAIYAMPVEVKKGMSGAQNVGSIITYARRYAMSAILGIAQTDDDAAVPADKPKEVRTQISKADPRPSNAEGPSEKQTGMIWGLATDMWGSDKEKTAEQLKAMCVRRGWPASSKELSREQASELIGHLTGMIATGGQNE